MRFFKIWTAIAVLVATMAGCTLTGPAATTDLGNELLSGAESGAYQLGQAVIPDSLKTQFVNDSPYKEDVLALGAFFEKEPTLPPAQADFAPDGYCEAGIGGSGGLKFIVLECGAQVAGIVAGVEPLCGAGCTFDHNTFYLKPDDPALLNSYNVKYGDSWPGGANTLKCYQPVTMTSLPAVGEHIVVDASFVIDLAWGGTACAPVRGWRKD